MQSLSARISACIILPCMMAKADITVDFPVIQDSWVNSNRATRNYGSDYYLQVKSSETRIPYLQFQTYGITGNVVSAQIFVRYLYNDTQTIYAHKVTDQTWDENSITYDNKPAWNAAATGSTPLAYGWISIPVTSDISGNGLFSYALLGGTGVNGDIYSREYGSTRAAYLRVTYRDANLAPVAQADTYNVLHNTLREVAEPGVLSNDSDPNNDPFTAQLVTAPAHGAVTLNPDGSFSYMPANGFSGTDTFTYQANDSNPLGALSSPPATVTLTVLAAGVGQLTASELNQIQTELGVTLDLNRQIDLATLVKPVTTQPWRADAEARIEQNRKADLNITVVNASGGPVPNATVEVKLKRKSFLFGGVLDLTEFSTGVTGGMTSGTYRTIPPKYFDAVGLNNALKPRQSFYQNPAVNTDRLENEFFPWCASIDMPCRGHLLQWPGLDHMSAPVEAKVVEIETVLSGGGTPTQTQLDELRALVDNEISTWAARWPVYQWDVVNEVLSNHRIQDIMGPDEITRWFQLAQTASNAAGHPDTGRVLNEFQIISANAATNGASRIASFKNQIQYLLDHNAPLTGLGFQSRFKFRREDPALLYSRLEQFAVYNKDMIGTEFEVVPNEDGSFTPDENLRGQITEEVMTTYFSHPKVTGLFAWEFASTEERALLNPDGSPRLNALVWYYLNRIRYSTRATLTTNAQGQASIRGFKGDYEIIVNTGSGDPYTIGKKVDSDTFVTVGGTTDHTLDVIEDCHAQEGLPSATAGNSGTLQLRKPNGSLGRVAYLKFDLSQIPTSIRNAKLRLYIPSPGSPENGETNLIQALAVSSSTWTESTLTWNNRPGTGALLGSGMISRAPGVLDIPIDPASLAVGGLWSVALNETGDSFGTIASSENANSYPIPKLLITTVNSISNHAPVFQSDPIPGTAATSNFAYTGTLAGTATDIDPGSTITYSKVSGPAWLVIQPNGGLSGTPASADIGTNTFTVSASDGLANTTATLNINVVSNETTLSVIEDTHAQEANPTVGAPGSLTLQLRTPNGSLGRIAYLKFNLSQISGTVINAKLRLYSVAEPHLIQALAVADNSWTEAGLTWNNRPATGAVLGSNTAAAVPGTLDITLDPASVTPGGYWSVALNETGNSYGTIASSENTSGYPIPQLILTTGTPDHDGDGIADALDPDDDNDGLPDEWETSHGLNPLNAADATADPDHDGLNNRIEYALALDPASPAGVSPSFRMEPSTTTPGAIHLIIRRRVGIHALPVRLEYSGGLNSWSSTSPTTPGATGVAVLQQTTTSGSDSMGTYETLDFQIIPNSAGQHLFLRLVVD